MEPVTITFAHPPDAGEHYQALADQFMQAYPEITVELVPLPRGRFHIPDGVDAFSVGNQFTFAQLRYQGDLLDLSPLIEQDAAFDYADFYPGTLNLFSGEGRVWGLPAGVDPLVLYYNKSLFAAAGLDVTANTWTWDDMLAAALAVRNPENGDFGYAIFEQQLDLIAMVMIYQHGGRLVDDLDNPTQVTFNDPLNVEAMDWLQSLYHTHDVAPTREQANDAFGYGEQAIYRGVLGGKVGMWPGFFSERGGTDWPADWSNLSWGMVALPQDAQAVTTGFAGGYAISLASPHPEAAWKWLTFLSEQVPPDLVPARRSAAESREFSERYGDEIAAAARRSVETITLISPNLVQFQTPLEAFSQAVQSIVDGSTTAQEALDGAQKQAEVP
jgi:multiple sugar transport system substrate-binding protein